MTEVQNRSVLGEPGVFALLNGNPPELGAGEHVGEFTPPDRLGQVGSIKLKYQEPATGNGMLTGTPLTMAGQQLLAWQHGLEQMGFGEEPVSFTVHWAHFRPSLFTVGEAGWVMEKPRKK